MDKTKHPGWLILITYSAMAFCWAGKNLLTLNDMNICAFAGLVRGAVTMITKKINIPDYICRGIGIFAAVLLVIEMYLSTGWIDSDVMTLVGSLIPPLAAGSMFVEGLCTARNISGKEKIKNALLISVSLAAGVFLAVAITNLRGLSIYGIN